MSRMTVLTNARIIDVETGRIKDNRDIIVSRDRIKEVGKFIDSRIGNSIDKIDCTDKYVIPGLFDCHTHITALTRQPKAVQREIFRECRLDVPFVEDQLLPTVLGDYLSKGITQLRDMGGPLDILSDVHHDITTGAVAGPVLFFSGPRLEQAPLADPKANARWPGWLVGIATKKDVDELIDDLIRHDAALIKSFGTGDPEIIKYLIASATAAELPVARDTGPTFFHNFPVDESIRNGIHCIEHGKSPWYTVLKDDLREEHDRLFKAEPSLRKDFIDRVIALGIDSISPDRLEKLVKMMNKKDVYICPTLQICKFYSEKPEVFVDRDADKYGRIFARLFKVSCFITSAMAAGGVKIMVGQDGYIPRFLQQEMGHLKNCGLGEIDILRGATLHPARWLGVDDLYGAVKKGRKANLVVLNSNPLAKIDGIKDIFLVMKDGKVVGNRGNSYRDPSPATASES